MHNEIYADGIGEITVNGQIVRIDLVSLSPQERDASGQPKAVFRQRMIMSVEGFANSVELMQKALQGMLDAGAVRRAPIPLHPTAKPEDMPRKGGSPNFG